MTTMNKPRQNRDRESTARSIRQWETGRVHPFDEVFAELESDSAESGPHPIQAGLAQAKRGEGLPVDEFLDQLEREPKLDG